MLSSQFWDKYFGVYDTLNELYPYQELLDTFIKELNLKEGEVVLDAGAGTGNLSQKIRGCGGVIYAIDISDAGTRRLLEKIPEAKTCIGSLCDSLPYPDNFFDAIVSNNVIYTLPEKDRPSVAREFFRVLKPGGRIVISNISPGFSPFKIYTSHVLREVKESGWIQTAIKILKFIPPTLLIFFYNARINREHVGGNYAFLDERAQSHFLQRAGFIEISLGTRIYAEQAVLHTAKKSK